MKRVFAVQVPPEEQESPLFLTEWDEVTRPGLVVVGNRYYNDHTVPVWDKWQAAYEDAIQHVTRVTLAPERASYDSVAALVNELLTPQHKEAYTEDEVSKWIEILSGVVTNGAPTPQHNLEALGLMTGATWKHRTIRGNSQSEWRWVYYNTDDWTDEAIRNFEIEYFNLGTEWQVQEGGNLTDPNDMDATAFMYCHATEQDEVTQEIAHAMGVAPSEVQLYTFKGWRKTAEYEKVGEE